MQYGYDKKEPGLRLPASASLPLASCWPRPSVARPALLRHIGPRASSRKWPGLPRAPPLGELAGASPTERARPLTTNPRHSDSIALTKSLPIAAQRLFRAGLALSVTFGATSPKGRGFGRPEGAKSPLGGSDSEGVFPFWGDDLDP